MDSTILSCGRWQISIKIITKLWKSERQYNLCAKGLSTDILWGYLYCDLRPNIRYLFLLSPIDCCYYNESLRRQLISTPFPLCSYDVITGTSGHGVGRASSLTLVIDLYNRLSLSLRVRYWWKQSTWLPIGMLRYNGTPLYLESFFGERSNIRISNQSMLEPNP